MNIYEKGIDERRMMNSSRWSQYNVCCQSHHCNTVFVTERYPWFFPWSGVWITGTRRWKIKYSSARSMEKPSEIQKSGSLSHCLRKIIQGKFSITQDFKISWKNLWIIHWNKVNFNTEWYWKYLTSSCLQEKFANYLIRVEKDCYFNSWELPCSQVVEILEAIVVDMFRC